MWVFSVQEPEASPGPEVREGKHPLYVYFLNSEPWLVRKGSSLNTGFVHFRICANKRSVFRARGFARARGQEGKHQL